MPELLTKLVRLVHRESEAHHLQCQFIKDAGAVTNGGAAGCAHPTLIRLILPTPFEELLEEIYMTKVTMRIDS